MPNKTKLSKELIDEFCKYVSQGLSVKDCCDILGISQSVYYMWQTEAETGYVRGDSQLGKAKNLDLKVQLVDELKKAYVKYKQIHIDRINNASQKDWYASAWMLERKFPDEFAKPDKFKLYGNKDSFEDLTPLGELLKDDEIG